MVEIILESPLFNETMGEEERHGLLGDTMKNAVENGREKWVDMLIAYGADPNCAWELEAPLTAIGNLQNVKTLDVLLAHGAWMKDCQQSMASTGHAADVLEGELKRMGQRRRHTVQLLIKEGFEDVDARDHRGRTPLMVAAAVALESLGPPPSHEIAKLLLDTGADLHAVNNNQQGVLHHVVNNKQRDAFCQAVGGWSPNCLRFLLERGASPNLQDVRGRTPVTTPVIRARYNIHGNIKEMLKLLLRAGADPFIRYNRSKCAAELLQRSETGLAFMHENPVFFSQRDVQDREKTL